MDCLASWAPQRSPRRIVFTVSMSQGPNMVTRQTQSSTEACAGYKPLFAPYRNTGGVMNNSQEETLRR